MHGLTNTQRAHIVDLFQAGYEMQLIADLLNRRVSLIDAVIRTAMGQRGGQRVG